MQVIFLGVNWPQYFSGYHRPTINFDMPFRNPTFAELADEIDGAISDYGYDLFDEEEVGFFDAYAAQLRTTPSKRCFDKPYTDRNVWRQWQRASMKDWGEDCMPQMYFSLGEPKKMHHGYHLTFLD